jgi:hypothetical protein
MKKVHITKDAYQTIALHASKYSFSPVFGYLVGTDIGKHQVYSEFLPFFMKCFLCSFLVIGGCLISYASSTYNSSRSFAGTKRRDGKFVYHFSRSFVD